MRGWMSGTPLARPWADVDFALPERIPTMITPEEVSYLYWLGRDFWDGEADLIEFGPWLGGSTYCLAAGMAANPRRSGSARLHVVDNFVWQRFMETIEPLGLAPGASFESCFEANLRDLAELLEVHRVRLPDEPVVDVLFDATMEEDPSLPLFDNAVLTRPLGVVFVDGAKSWRGLSHMLRQLAPRCVPGATLMVFQDCKLAGAYWVQMGLAKLDELDPGGLALRHILPFNSVACEVTAGAHPERWAELPETIDDIAPAEAVGLLERCRAIFEEAGDPEAAHLVRVSEVVMLGSKGRWDEARLQLRRLDREQITGREDPDLENARAWLERETGRRCPPPPARRALRLGRRALGGARRRLARSSRRGGSKRAG